MLKVLKTGLYTSVQDLGRTGYRKYGVPLSGVMDAFSARQANLLLNNAEGCAVLECTQNGPALLFTKPTHIAVCGADMEAQLNQQPIAFNKVSAIKANDILSFGKLRYGLRSYLAVKDGFKTALMLNSRSYYQPLTVQQTLVAEQGILYDAFDEPLRSAYVKLSVHQAHFESPVIEVHQGPEFDLLTPKNINALFKTTFHTGINNRMAYQLKEPLTNNLNEILTSAVLPGTVQLTPSGKLIILMRDAQTTGGYPRILQLTETAINRLAQKKLMDEVLFKLVDNF